LRHAFLRSGGKEPQTVLKQLIDQVQHNSLITTHLQSHVVSTGGFMGNFVSTVQDSRGEKREVQHGITILATGAQEYRGPEYGFGTHPNIITQQQFEFMLQNQQSAIRNPQSIVMIQCVGPAEKYCSRICCTEALKNAIALKAQKPEAQVVILYKDIRTYGFKERLYKTAREHGVVFMRYDNDHKPEVVIRDKRLEIGDQQPNTGALQSAVSNQKSEIEIQAWDSILQRSITLRPDLLVLSMPVVPRDDAHEVAKLFKVSLDADGFFLEAHVKLRPVDFASDGVFMAGMAHYPKLLDETMIQAQAAASRAARVLSHESLTAGGRVAVVDDAKCTGCLTCVRICPFGVPKIKANLTGVGNIVGAAYIEAAVCQGCGSCVAECPAQAIQLMHYTDAQMHTKVHALLEATVGFVPMKEIEVSNH
jgi:heterodisulfide reductase subunit A-like polyferredoxin